jgi:tetratricopeptide (TPR) repeat protein
LAADAVAQAIAQLDGVQVVPLTAALLSLRHVDAVAGDTRGVARARLAAEETGAATVVGGAYYAVGEELVMQGWIGDVRDQRVLGALRPARAPLAAPMAAIESLGDQACTSLALQLETRVTHVRAAGRAPSYEAHGAYVEGLARFVDADWRAALLHLERSAASDTTYALPLIVSAIARWNLGELEAADALAGRAGAVLGGSGPFERALLDMVRAWLAGDWAAAYDAVRRQSELAPGTIASFQMAEEARRRNRPREALRLLGALDPMRGELRGWVFYWVVMAQALHALGEHAQELVVARRARDLHPDSPIALQLEVQARAALGDVPGVLACVEESLATPTRQEPRAGTLLRAAGLELRAHAVTRDAADAFLAQSLVWYEELPEEERALPAMRRAAARARYDVGDWEGAQAAFATLAGERIVPTACGAVHHPHLQAHLDHGYLGAIAVRLGDVAEADRIEALLASTRGPYLFGSTHYWRAALAALRGDGVAAARLLRRALAGGLPYEPFIHVDPHFAPVRGVPEFAAVLEPRG